MAALDSAIELERPPLLTSGALSAFLGVLIFSFTFPATTYALEGFGPWSTTGVRGVLAAVVAIAALAITRQRLPARKHWPALAVVSGGTVIGFPLLTSLALQTSSTAHSAVVIGLLPMATAIISTLRTGRRPSRLFWAAATVGAVAVFVFMLAQSHGVPTGADLYLIVALLICAAGYAEGGRLASEMPGWTVVAWAIVAAAPVNVIVAALAMPHERIHITVPALLGLAYVAVFSQFLGFVVWYRGMALIGVARASQFQLAQPLLTLVWSAAVLGEHFSPFVPATAVVVLACIAVTQKARD